MALALIQSPSINFDSRDNHAIDMLVLHYTGMKTATDALERLRDQESKVSSHYMVDEDGSIHQLVDEEQRAWHAGVSSWRGNSNINQRSIGIEIVNPGHEFGYRPFPAQQMTALSTLCLDILSRHTIAPRNIIAHSDIAPTRKKDPGELFDWSSLASQRIGLFPNRPSTESATQEFLTTYGYDMSDPKASITAFQRHFRPNRIDGKWDNECAGLLAALFQLV